MNMVGLSLKPRRNSEGYTQGENSLIIVRPTVIFGEGNRGNVYNLLNQIASGKFLMVGKGENKNLWPILVILSPSWRRVL